MEIALCCRSGATRKSGGAERSGARGCGAGTERGAEVTGLCWSVERLFRPLRSAHMLCSPIRQRARGLFRTRSTNLLIIIIILATCQSSYLYNLLQVHQSSRALCSSTQKLLQVPYLSTDFSRRAFSCNSPSTWNSFPTSIKNCSSLYSFKHHLTSHLIAQLINN